MYKAQINMEAAMVFENLEVLHSTFGKGVVLSKNDKYITVKFDACQKVFVYPDAFEKFLTLADGTVSDEIKAALVQSNDRKQMILNKKNEENMRSMTHGIVIPGKENVQSDSDDDESGSKSSDTDEI